MNRKLVSPAAISILLILSVILIFPIACTKHSNPVSSLNQTIPQIANIQTQGEPEFACVYNDTVYVADNQAGVARISLLGQPSLLTEYKTGSATHGYIWVGYDSVKHRVLAGDRLYTTNRLIGSGSMYTPDTSGTMTVTEYHLNQSPFCSVFHDPDTIMHYAACNSGYNVYTEWIFDTTSSSWLQQNSAPGFGYHPNTLSTVQMAIPGKPYTFAVADEYGFVTIEQETWEFDPPHEVAHLDLPGQAIWMAKRNSICYVATKWSGISVVSVSDPLHPQLIRNVPLANSDNQYQIEVSVDGSKLFLLDNYKGVFVYTLNDPTNPQFLGLITILKPVGMVCYRNYLIVCSESEGVDIYQW